MFAFWVDDFQLFGNPQRTAVQFLLLPAVGLVVVVYFVLFNPDFFRRMIRRGIPQ